jgi:hypothetical protein
MTKRKSVKNYEELENFVNERDEGICQNCGDICKVPRVFNINFVVPKKYDPDEYWLVCGKCFTKFSKRMMSRMAIDY